MKTNAIIPIFISHQGCENDCVFCNQRKITSKETPMTPLDATLKIEECLPSIEKRGVKQVEIGFFGGSFTGMDLGVQEAYLSIAKPYKDKGKIKEIRLSTRPDYIDEKKLIFLKQYGVDTIELGVQSFDEQVLSSSNRGYKPDVIYSSSRLIKSYGFKLGIQLMIGLPEDTYEKSIYSAKETVKLNPEFSRIYPTVIVKDTELETRYHKGEYQEFPLETAVKTAKDMYLILTESGIQVIRLGLKSTDNIGVGKDLIGTSYHPAFRQLVEGEIAKEKLEVLITNNPAFNTNFINEPKEKGNYIDITFYGHPSTLSNMAGHKKSNFMYFKEKYKGCRFHFKGDESLLKDNFKIKSFKKIQ